MSRLAGCFAGMTALTLACGGAPSDRAGGVADVDTIVLTMAYNSDQPPEWAREWANDVAARSGGSLRIEFTLGWRHGEPEFETGTIADVRVGEVDIASIGPRAFDRVGVTSFQALHAPMLIDSVDLEQAVFDAGIPDEMLAGLGAIGLVGIGIVPGDLFKMLGVSHPFVAPDDFAGQLVGIQDSALSEQTMLALGATTRNMGRDAGITSLDGYALSIGSIAGFQYWRDASYVTANVNLWPRPTVVFMNGERFDSLTEDQQRIMRDAAARIVEGQWAVLGDADVEPVSNLCERGMTLAVATDDDLAALRSALQPVYDQIADDPDSAAWLDQIEQLKAEVNAPIATAECPHTGATIEFEEGGFPNGMFASTLTTDDVVRACGEDMLEDMLEAFGELPFTMYGRLENGQFQELVPLEDGTFDIGSVRATYTVVRDRLEFHEVGYPPVSFHWTFDGTQLVLSDQVLSEPPVDDRGVCEARLSTAQPWVLVDDAITTPETTETT